MRKSVQALSLKHYCLAGGAVALFLGSGIVVFLCGCRSTVTPMPPKEARTYQSILQWSLQNGMPGAMLLVQTPKTNFIGCVGWADRKRKIPLRPDHAFRIGSLTKTFVSVVAAQMEVERQLEAVVVIPNYLPSSVPSHIANSDQITVRHLLRHTSGLYNFEWNNAYILRR